MPKSKEYKPSECIRCKIPNSADGFYQTGTGWKVGICKKHKAHGGARIHWYKREDMTSFEQMMRYAIREAKQ
jgi:hypothetical protein